MEYGNNKKDAERWIYDNKPCCYQHGWGWKGASMRYLTQKEALLMLPNYDFGKGFYELDYCEHKGETVLRFNELSENDMW